MRAVESSCTGLSLYVTSICIFSRAPYAGDRTFSIDAMLTTEASRISSGASTTPPQSVAADPGKNERRRLRYEKLFANAPKPKATPCQIIPRATDVKLNNKHPAKWHNREKSKATSATSRSKATERPTSQRSGRAKRWTHIAPRHGPTIKELFQKQLNEGAPHCAMPNASRVSAPTPRPVVNAMDSGSQQAGGLI